MPSAATSSALAAGALLTAGALALAPAAVPTPRAGPGSVRASVPGAAPVPGTVAWSWPLRPAPRVLRGFDVLPSRYAAGHRGVDLAAEPGAQVLAAAAGTVTFAGPVAGRGVVVVAHADGLRTTYEPLLPGVRAGEGVRAGAVLGTLAPAPRHCPRSGCLHWGARRGPDHVDPLALLGAAVPVLLPPGRP